MPAHRKTSSWQSTVAGTISVNCPDVFMSGTAELGESGWWTLQTFAPPRLESVLRMISGIDTSLKHQIILLTCKTGYRVIIHTVINLLLFCESMYVECIKHL